MEKKALPILAGLMIILLICSSTFLCNQKQAEHEMRTTAEGIAGSSLYMIWINYNAILENETDMLTIEHINDIYVKLSVIEAYSATVGRLVNTQLLTPISIDMKAITESMQESYKENNIFTEEDQTKYATLITEITALLPLISKVFYVSESQEGAKVTLEVNNKETLLTFRDALKKHVSGLNNV
ncbi:hypothetical protein [Paenibacillus sinopodophylli]|uniref:hypothetical protein n=1 Tax=Paenibacillus sinopodophylli TaxID=1837342 RepID=UPI00110CB25A|nr:hypothetical protein [Paenibacillus sinopodophylli]